MSIEIMDKNFGNFCLKVDDWNHFLRTHFKFDKTHIPNNGVYLISDFYIGRTCNLRNRLKRHVGCCFNGYSYNDNLSHRIITGIVNNEVMPVCVLDRNVTNERKIIKEYIDRGFNYFKC